MTDYNGWTNYETWNVALWIDNDQGEQERWAERAQEIATDGPDDPHGFVADGVFVASRVMETQLADELQEAFEEAMPDLGACVWSDLLSASLSEVNWREIAAHYFADVEIEEEEVEA